MEVKIRKDDMGYNWLLCTDGLVLAFGAQKSFKSRLVANEVYLALGHSLRVTGFDLDYLTRQTIGLFALETPDDSPLRFATLHETELDAKRQVGEVLSFIAKET